VAVGVDDPHLCKDTARKKRPIAFAIVIVLLPPSETKHAGGDGPPLRLDAWLPRAARCVPRWSTTWWR
jgi:hypothetical protein